MDLGHIRVRSETASTNDNKWCNRNFFAASITMSGPVTSFSNYENNALDLLVSQCVRNAVGSFVPRTTHNNGYMLGTVDY